MYTKYLKNEVVKVNNLKEGHILIDRYAKEGVNANKLYKVKEYPVYVSIHIDTSNISISKDPNGEITPFFKIIKKSFIFKLINLRNEKSNYHKKISKFIYSLNRGSDYSSFQSTLDKNSFNIGSLHFAIDFLLGNEIEFENLFRVDRGVRLLKSDFLQ